MEPARKLDYPSDWNRPSPARPKASEPERILDEDGKEIPPWDIKLGKMIFYLTIAMAIWFFYWFNGIQCPC